MKFSISREALIKPLNLVAGVVERRQTLPILSNVLLSLEGTQLSLTGTDLEVELIGRVEVEAGAIDGEITVPARKLVDICKSLPDSSQIEFSVDSGKATVKAGRGRFTLSTLPATEFPSVDESAGDQTLEIAQSVVKRLIDRTAFAMAQQDVRYYLNGMLLELKAGRLRMVATDGHRLALCTAKEAVSTGDAAIIIPRKGVLELSRLLDTDESIRLVIGSNHIRAANQQFTFTSKLVDGKFPEYERVLPKSADKTVIGQRLELRQAFTRTAILSNEKYRGVRLKLSADTLDITANNPEQEQAEEVVAVEYQGDELEVGFNVSYLLDVLSVLDGEQIRLSLSDSASSALLEEADEGDSLYVVMPMRL
ncbi:DNA polymerase III subunit beta [Luminiphilus sp.]|nr:DNA polymerase III subunit beta [Luminiphilus sp.]MDA8827870.1 DNA polymerase III subunit beta [Luminiphilus sp.]MDB2351799.1 DNA polymerase III subunit beta [Luminiphilus sp.]MDB2376756.1 DNA polymerase III subunit beta [Luminiphilus sp.]MDC3405783.1 DNA polymerase III subunit beta [Luminiphilus sp.]